MIDPHLHSIPLAAGPLPPDINPAGEERRTFDETLAARIAATRAPPLPGPPPVPEHGPAIVSGDSLGIPGAGAELILSSAPETPPADAPVAERFNEDGFFGSPVQAVASTDVEAPCRIGLPAITPREAAVIYPPAELTPDGGNRLQAPGAPKQRHGVVSHDIRISPARSAGPTPDSRLRIPVPHAAAAPELEETEVVYTPEVARSQRRPAGQSMADVAVHELERGLLVAIQLDAVGEGERERMRDEILALLSRHGLAADRVIITAPRAISKGQQQ